MRHFVIVGLLLGFASTSLAEPLAPKSNSVSPTEVTMKAFELGFFSIPVSDIQVAKSFYGKVMGWEFNERDSAFSYIFANENMIASLEKVVGQFAPSENGPLMFFRADFMERTLTRVTDNGGTVREKIAIENGARGYTAKVLDPFQNTIAFWAPEN